MLGRRLGDAGQCRDARANHQVRESAELRNRLLDRGRDGLGVANVTRQRDRGIADLRCQGLETVGPARAYGNACPLASKRLRGCVSDARGCTYDENLSIFESAHGCRYSLSKFLVYFLPKAPALRSAAILSAS